MVVSSPVQVPVDLSDELRGGSEDFGRRGLPSECFVRCVAKALKDEYPTRRFRCTCVLKILWLCWLFLLAFGLVAAGFKPVAFLVHKAVHDKLYYILRPVRLSMVTILPYLDQVGFDFLNTDCMLENPLLHGVEGCACFRIKFPEELVLNSSTLPHHVTKSGLLDVYVLRNVSQFDQDFSIMNFVQFPSLNGGLYPFACHEMLGLDSRMNRYDEFFQEDTVTKSLSDHQASWSFSWDECPDSTNPLTLHSIIPPMEPPLHLTPNATFTLATKWGSFTHYQESFPSGAVVVARVLLGEARFVLEPKQEECMGICSVFRKNPVLKQGDALVFDQRVWTYFATSWTDVTFITVQLVSLV